MTSIRVMLPKPIFEIKVTDPCGSMQSGSQLGQEELQKSEKLRKKRTSQEWLQFPKEEKATRFPHVGILEGLQFLEYPADPTNSSDHDQTRTKYVTLAPSIVREGRGRGYHRMEFACVFLSCIAGSGAQPWVV